VNETGTYRITAISDTRELVSCTHIDGSLAIVGLAGNYNPNMEAVLENNLGMIEVITGQLKIMHSHALISLNFLRNLRAINGEYVVDGTYNPGMADELTEHSLVVKDNKRLKQLWDWDSRPKDEARMEIKAGKLFFHFNPKLCLSEIDKLIEVANLKAVSNLEVSRESNGDQTLCDSVPFNVTVEKRTPNSIILALHVSPELALMSSRFIVFYRESLGMSLNESTLYESINQCGDNEWRVTNDAESNLVNGTHYIILPHLEPAVEYIFFVRSFSSTINTSRMQKVTTLPAQPSIPLDLVLNYTTASSIVLSWTPPRFPHGELKYFTVRGYFQTDRRPDLLERNYCVNRMKNEPWTPKSTVAAVTTPVPSSTDVCGECPSNNVTTTKDVEETCDAYEHKTFFDISKNEPGLEGCDAYIYRLIEAKKLMVKAINKQVTREFSEPKSHVSEDVYSAYPDKPEIGIDGRYDVFWLKVNANTTTVEVDNLRHFSQYVVMVAACQDPEMKIPCSRDAIITARTAPDTDADRIDGTKVGFRKYNQTVNVSWDEPNLVNSFIHSYILSYRSKDVENVKFEDKCITTKEFHKSNNTYSLLNLPSGQYEIRIRAISLSGEGPYFATTFHIEEFTRRRISLLAMGIIAVALIIAAVCFLFFYLRHLSKKRVLYASVNPKYEPVYIEDHYEVPRENLTLIRQLGRGIFGSVHEGILEPDKIRCAVKTTTASSDEDNVIFLKEATLMKEFHKAYHIVKLIGVISKGTPVYVIMELMEQGDLTRDLLEGQQRKCNEG
jgi:hypothetical protein